MNPTKFHINGVILAGGKGSRMGYQDKPLLALGNKRIIDWILQSATPQVEKLVLNVNRNAELYANLLLPAVADTCSNEGGPLAGIHAAMLWTKANDPDCTHLACFPGDVPWFDANYVRRVIEKMIKEDTQVGWLQTQLQRQPLFSVWDIRQEPALRQALQNNFYSPMKFIQSQPNSLVIMSNTAAGHYLNLNTPEELAQAESLLADGIAPCQNIFSYTSGAN